MSGTEDKIRRALLRSRRWHWAEILFWLALAGSFFLLPDYHLLLTEIAIWALFALSLDLILGYAGIVSLGHGAFFGLGAYAAGLAAIHLTANPLAGLGLAALAGGTLGLLTAPLLLRRASDLSRLMVTLGIAMLLQEAANRMAWLTGGTDGLPGIMIDPIFGVFEFDLFGRTGYAYALIVLFALFWLARMVVHSGFGLSLRAIRDNPLRAGSIGVPIGARLVVIYALAGAMAAVAGALLTQTTMFASIDMLAFHRSAEVLLVLVLGGVGYLYGGLLGAIVFKLLQEGLSTLTPQYWQFWMGLILVLIVLAGRERISQRIALMRGQKA